MKLKNKIQQISILLIAGFTVSVSTTKLWFLIACFGLIPIFVFQFKNSKIKIALSGFLFGIGVGIGLFHWMIEGAKNYTGDSPFFGFLIACLSTFFMGLYFAFLNWMISFIWVQKTGSKYQFMLNRIAVAAVWTLSEYLIFNLFEGLPLYNFKLGFSFVSNLYFVQLTSYGGLIVLTFVAILTNVLLTEFYLTKKIKYIFFSLTFLLGIYSIGALTYFFYSPIKAGGSFKVALVSDNTNPEIKWNSENGNELASNYLKLCKQATALHPDFIIWPETAVPWTYNKEDDLLKEMIQISKNDTLTHVIGINNENKNTKKLYNSVFYINTKNQVKGIYQKQILLKGIEQPVGKLIVPFLSQEGFVLSKGAPQKPVITSFGKAGNLVCNEVVSEKCSAEQVKNGVNFFFNLSNDGWFKDTYISDLHFYYARLQAVENRKDICVSNNCGINGIISSDGNIVSEMKDCKATCITGYIQPNNDLSFFAKYPYLFPSLYTLIICINLFINYKQF